MRVAILREEAGLEPRVAASADTVKRYVGLGAAVFVASGAGLASGIGDSDYEGAGATVVADNEAAVAGADIVLAVRRPAAAALKGANKGALVIAIADPFGHEAALEEIAGTGASLFAMELMPRITRAQVMDVLSSQANLAGYRAVIDASSEFGRAFPMMMTAAGTVPAARVFVMGAGVAGLQAIATARRLGAVVSATDVRPAAKEQVESLGGKFIAVEDEEFKQAETSGGYAKAMSAEYQQKQAALTASHIAKQDIVITTALIPGRPAPKLVSGDMVASMKPGSVLIDLAVERGGNVEGAVPGEVATTANGVKIVGHLNVPGRLAATASQLYAKNLYAFVETLIDKTSKSLAVKWDDELVKATLLTRDGAVVHPGFAPAAPAAEVPAAAAASAEAPSSAA
ncbi:Re/Si-specific NAD(P)(+) transhydrogenase subunit alpha [Ancylobacter dichloromethanicus]|uniref:Re/Si-specific NAD(P)(+) transhydrogenase subunit alpha n=2 Tax=Ancylobacter dichloromethanicus TaxID=518825 RepID=UPI00361B1320